MAFSKAASVGRVAVTAQTTPDETALASVTVTFDVLDATGVTVATRHHDLLTNLTAAQKTALFTLLTNLRTKLTAEAV